MSIAHLGLEDEHPEDHGERVPPHDLLAEQSALGGMMLSRTAVEDVMEVLHARDHYIPKHEVIHEAIVHLAMRNDPTDVIAVAAELKKTGELTRAGGEDYLHILTALVPTAANAGYYAEIVAEKAVLRRLVESGTRIVQMGYASEGDPTTLVEHARAEVDQIMVGGARQVRMIGDTMLDLVEDLEAPPVFLPTPWESLDKIIGGFAPGTLTVIAARPGEGKSIALLQAATKFAHAGLVAFSSLEMTERELQLRLISQFGSVHMKDLRNHTLTDIQWKLVADARAAVQGAPIFIDESEMATVASIRAHARAVGRKGKLAAILVDYLQLVDGEGQDRRLVVDNVSKALKQLAKSLNVPVIAAAQLNRGERGRGKERPLPTLRDLREAGGIEANADVVILMHRDVERHPGDVKFIVAKNRHGAQGQVTMRWQAEYARIRDKDWTPYSALIDEKEMQ